MNRKAQGLSLNIIIVAAIGLLVLVILSVIFIGKMGGTSRDIDNCESKGGTCVDDEAACEAENGKPAPSSYKCLDAEGEPRVDKPFCCITI